MRLDEVARHRSAEDCWVAVEGGVYDVSGFLGDHPGGRKVLLQEAGTDATRKFRMFHASSVLTKYAHLKVGDVDAEATETTTVADARHYGNGVPFGDPAWYRGWNSGHYSDSHRRFRAAIRAFVEAEIVPHVHEWDEAKKMPRSMWKKAGDANLLALVVGPPWLSKYIGSDQLPGGVSPGEFDAFHELIANDEVCRCGSGGVVWALYAGLAIGLPPVLHFGTEAQKNKVVGPCLRGEKIICLCITEPSAGSDVAQLTTTAEKTPDGKHYIVNGQKKWITNGVFADFFTVAVRTGGPGAKGISVLLLERSMPGITTTQMQCSGVWTSGTTYITFEDVRVPVANLIGKENEGFKIVMYNFNHERWMLCVQAVRFARCCLEDSFEYAAKRKTFGKTLLEHPVIRMKLAEMARQVEAAQAWLESVTYQMKTMDKKEQNEKLGGAIALLKAHTTKVFEYCAREAAQVFGGLAYTRGGQGERVERLYREVRAYAIPGGSEEIMLDLGVRQPIKSWMTKL